MVLSVWPPDFALDVHKNTSPKPAGQRLDLVCVITVLDPMSLASTDCKKHPVRLPPSVSAKNGVGWAVVP